METVTATGEYVQIVSSDGRLIFICPEGLDLLGMRSLEDVKGSFAVDAVCPEYREEWIVNHQRICDGNIVDWTYDVFGPIGHRHHVHARAVPIQNDDGTTGQLAIIHEVPSTFDQHLHELNPDGARLLLKSFLQNAPIGFAVINEKYEYVHVNKALADINGVPSQQHIGKTVMDILPGNSEHLVDILGGIFKTGKAVHNIEIRGATVGKPARERSWLATFYPIADRGSPEVKYVGAAVLEITDRVNAERALKDSEQQFRDFSNNIQNLAWMARGDGWVYWYNRRWYDYTGTTPEQMQGWGWTSVHHPDHADRITEFIRNAWQRGQEWELTFPLRGKNGDYRWFLTRAYPVKDAQGTVTRWIGTNTDIHEKLQIQEELQQSRDRLRQVADFMPQIVWSTDEKGNHDFFNRRWYEFSGLTYEESKNEQWDHIVHPEDIARMTETWRESLNSGKLYEAEYRVRRKDGEYRWILARAMPLRRADGTIERWFGSSTDIHDQRTMASKLEELVQERTKELRRSNEALQQFAHVASHDLKEPVRKIQTYENIITKRFQESLPAKVIDYLSKIRKSARRIAKMVEGVLLYSSVEGSTMMVEPIDLNTVVNNVAEDLELLVAEKNASLEYHKLPVIKGVPTLIHQLFYNLVNNALKFSGDKPPLIRINSKQVNRLGASWWEIVIEDNGIGFSNEYSESIFHTFTRLNSKDAFEGTGLGLALCKKIVERHGGSIQANGQEGHGAKFTIMFPVE